MLFMGFSPSLYVEDVFWNYSEEMKKSIEDFSYEIYEYNFKHIFKYPLWKIIHLLCIISHKIWKKSPIIEKILFRPIKRLVEIFELNKKANFIYQI